MRSQRVDDDADGGETITTGNGRGRNVLFPAFVVRVDTVITRYTADEAQQQPPHAHRDGREGIFDTGGDGGDGEIDSEGVIDFLTEPDKRHVELAESCSPLDHAARRQRRSHRRSGEDGGACDGERRQPSQRCSNEGDDLQSALAEAAGDKREDGEDAVDEDECGEEALVEAVVAALVRFLSRHAPLLIDEASECHTEERSYRRMRVC